MKLTDRIVLIKAGYSKEEIKAMIEEDIKASEEKPVPEGKGTEDFMAVITNLANEVKSMKNSIQQENIDNTSIKEVSNLDEATKILTSIINPNTTNKEE